MAAGYEPVPMTEVLDPKAHPPPPMSRPPQQQPIQAPRAPIHPNRIPQQPRQPVYNGPPRPPPNIVAAGPIAPTPLKSSAEKGEMQHYASVIENVFGEPEIVEIGATTRTSSSGSNESAEDDKKPAITEQHVNDDKHYHAKHWKFMFESTTTSMAVCAFACRMIYFPSLIARYGGLFALFFLLAFVCLTVPLMYMEVAIGQYASASPLYTFSNITPILGGLAVSMNFMLVLRMVAHAAWTVNHLGLSFTTHVNCDKVNPLKVYTNATAESCLEQWKNMMQQRHIPDAVTSAQWSYPVYTHVAAGIVVWLAVFLLALSGAKHISRFSIVALFLAVAGTIALLIGACLNPQFVEGIYAIRDLLFDGEEVTAYLVFAAWRDAVVMALACATLASGTMQKIASLNRFRHRLHWDVLALSIFILLFIIVHTLTVYSYSSTILVLINLNPAVHVEDRIKLMDSPLFMESVVPEVLMTHKFGWLYCFFYFFVTGVSGIQSITVQIWVICSMVVEKAHNTLAFNKINCHVRHTLILVFICIMGCLSTLPLTTPGSTISIELLREYADYGTIFVAFFEILAIAHLYGFRRFLVNIRVMVGYNGPVYTFFWLNWLVAEPAIIAVAVVGLIWQFTVPSRFLPQYYGVLGDTVCLLVILCGVIVLMGLVFPTIFAIAKEIIRYACNHPCCGKRPVTGVQRIRMIDWKRPVSSERCVFDSCKQAPPTFPCTTTPT
ncbi:hypothetical protein WR25_23165 [Diploscapter pachys]|uniref:Amino acid permease/ SLC12A domain-containing protein n=1 Tax=Diploscapter pachys TaxID=2018661 RepID=A0A2A2LZU9_9BILA|nr:hypothetical protein WR25_23165 [Diploscapter pachys]